MKQKAIEIFKNRPKYTNCFINYNKFLTLIENEIFFIESNNIFILKSENGIFKFLYFVDSLKDIGKSNAFLKNINTPVALEFVTKDIKNIPKFEDFGFIFYKVFSRYFVNKENRILPKSIKNSIQLADKNDIEEIYSMVIEIFDPLCDFIPTINELESFVHNKELYVAKNNEILGFALYLKQPYGYELRIFCISSKYRSIGLGYDFVASLPNDKEICKCWIDDNNYASIHLNKLIGFTIDGLKNYIFVQNLNN